MKVTMIIATVLIAQVSASFMEVFQGAVLSVQNSFGKLFSDVVTDVKDTVDCTILAVEHILSLTEDATARYYKKCTSAKNDTSDSQTKNNFPMLEISIANRQEHLKKELPEEIDARINATLLKYLNDYNLHDKLEDVQKEVSKETKRLADMSNLVRQELDKLSKEIHLDFTYVEQKGPASVDSILDQLKILQVIEQNIRNSSEANEIHRLVDGFLNKLHEIESSGAKQNDKVDGILRSLEKKSSRSYKDIREQVENWKAEEARHLKIIKLKMDEYEKLPKHLEYAKMDYTFATIEQPKIFIPPTDANEIDSRTTPLDSKNIMESMPTNILINSDKFTSVPKHILSTPKIAIQPSLDVTSPVQINYASGVTPVTISTSAYVNRNNIDVMDVSQIFNKGKPLVDHVPEKKLDFSTRMGPEAIRNLSMPPKSTTYVPVTSPQLAMIPQTATDLLVTVNDLTKSLTTIPELTTAILETLSESTKQMTPSTLLTATESKLLMSPESTRHVLPTAIEPINNLAVNPELRAHLLETAAESNHETTSALGTNTNLQVTDFAKIINPAIMTKPTTTIPVTSKESITSPTISGDSHTSIQVTTSRYTNFEITPKLSINFTMAYTESTANVTKIPEDTTNFLVTTSTNSVSKPKPLQGSTTEPVTSLTRNAEPTSNILMTTTESSAFAALTVDLIKSSPEIAGSTENFTRLLVPTTSTQVAVTDTHKGSKKRYEEISKNPVTAPEFTILDMTLESTNGLPLVTVINYTRNAAMPLEITQSQLVSGLKVPSSYTTPSELTASVLSMDPESIKSFIAVPETSTHQSMMTTQSERISSTTLPTFRDISVMSANRNSTEVNLESTMDLSLTTPELYTNPGLTSGHSDLQVTYAEKFINPLMTSELTTNIPVVNMKAITDPTIIQDSNMSLPIVSSQPTIFGIKPRLNANLSNTSIKFITHKTTPELATHLPLKTPVSKVRIDYSKEPTKNRIVITSGYRSPMNISEPLPNLLAINPDVTTRTPMILETIQHLPVMISQPDSYVTTQDPNTDSPLTIPEPKINSTWTEKLPTIAPITTTEFTTNQLMNRTDINTRTDVISPASKIISETSTSLISTLQEPINSFEPNYSVLDTNLSHNLLTFKPKNTRFTINTKPITKSVFQEPKSTYHAKSRERSTSSTATVLEPTPATIMTTLGHTSISKSKLPEQVIKRTKNLRETTTSRSVITSGSPTSSTETMLKSSKSLSTTSLSTISTFFTNNLRKHQYLGNLPTHRPGISTPSLNAFLNYIDRKEGFTRPKLQYTEMITTVSTPGSTINKISITPSPFIKPRSDKKGGPRNAKLNAFFSHLPHETIPSPYARGNKVVPINGTVPASLILKSPKMRHITPLPYIMNPSVPLNKNVHPKSFSHKHSKPERSYNESPNVGNNNAPPLAKAIPQKRHVLPERVKNQNPPIQPSVSLTDETRSLGLTTIIPVPNVNTNHYNDVDYKSFFHPSSKDSEAHSRALKEAKKLIEDSERAHRIIDNIFKKQNKRISAFNFSKSLKFGK